MALILLLERRSRLSRPISCLVPLVNSSSMAASAAVISSIRKSSWGLFLRTLFRCCHISQATSRSFCISRVVHLSPVFFLLIEIKYWCWMSANLEEWRPRTNWYQPIESCSSSASLSLVLLPKAGGSEWETQALRCSSMRRWRGGEVRLFSIQSLSLPNDMVH